MPFVWIPEMIKWVQKANADLLCVIFLSIIFSILVVTSFFYTKTHK